MAATSFLIAVFFVLFFIPVCSSILLIRGIFLSVISLRNERHKKRGTPKKFSGVPLLSFMQPHRTAEETLPESVSPPVSVTLRGLPSGQSLIPTNV